MTTLAKLYPALQTSIDKACAAFGEIAAERKERLAQLASYMQQIIDSGQPILLTFICTHNSRRSHMSQLWAQAAAYYFGIPKLRAFSGGTEATAFYASARQAMEDAGFQSKKLSNGPNPCYEVRLSDATDGLRVYSKTYDHPDNPSANYCAIMTCTDADENCPIVFGTEQRISLPFEDPKCYDGTEQETEKYTERSQQIARELLYAFSLLQVKKS